MNTEILGRSGEQLIFLLKDKGFTQEELVEEVGVHSIYIGKIKDSKSNIIAFMLFKLSVVLIIV